MWVGAAMMLAVVIGAANIPIGKPVEVRQSLVVVSRASSFHVPSQLIPGVAVVDCHQPKEIGEIEACAAQASAREARFSGYWALASVFVGFMTLVSVIFGFRQSREVQKQEYKAYLKFAFRMDSITYKDNVAILGWVVDIENYGRTYAERIKIDLDLFDKAHTSAGGDKFSTWCLAQYVHPTNGIRIPINFKPLFVPANMVRLADSRKDSQRTVAVNIVWKDIFGLETAETRVLIADFRRRTLEPLGQQKNTD